MALEFENLNQHFAMLKKHVYGLMDDRIEKLKAIRVNVQLCEETGLKITYLLKPIDKSNTADYTVNPSLLFNSVDDLLTQMAIDFQTREKLNKNSKK